MQAQILRTPMVNFWPGSVAFRCITVTTGQQQHSQNHIPLSTRIVHQQKCGVLKCREDQQREQRNDKATQASLFGAETVAPSSSGAA